MFTRSINQIAQIVYNDKSESGIYSNRYGRDEQMYYLYTKEDKCPENKQPKDDVFPISNIKDFVPQMEEVQVDDTNNNNDESNNNNTQKQQQQQQLHSEQLAHQNSSGPKTSEEIQKQTCFYQKEVFKVFMPQGSVYEEYSDPGKACLEAMTERRKTVCLDYMKIGFMQSLAETSEVKHQHMSNIKSK